MTNTDKHETRRILVTGASGFIGHGLIPALTEAGFVVRAAQRGFGPLPPGVESAVVGDLRKPVNLTEALRDVDAIVHAAGLAHVDPGIPEADYRAINAGVTAALARAGKSQGVRRFVLLSSVRAQCGPYSEEVLTENMEPRPTDAYGRSKLEAEQLLGEADIDHVAFRPALVHGPGMRFNMAALMKLALRRAPLPLALFRARRSILARDHLVSAIILALKPDVVPVGTYLVADPEPLTVGEMVTAIRRGRGRRPGIFPVPPPLVAMVARRVGHTEALERLSRPLVVDSSRLAGLGWHPSRNSADALAETARLHE